MSAATDTGGGWTVDDPDVDHYPTLGDVLARISAEVGSSDLVVERVEITCLASGEATYRMWEPRADESEGGYLAPAG